jgi:cytochrome c oxidase assembly protein subunit 15
MQVMEKVPAKALRVFATGLVVLTLFLVFMGGQVKSHDAGLAVPDWPTTYGQNMFTFPPAQWIGNIFHEHVHRLVASAVGLCTVVLAAWLFFKDKRGWMKGLGLTAVALVIAQGVLGGLTVLYLLPTGVSVAHGVLAQSFLALTIVLAYALSGEWFRRKAQGNTPPEKAARIAALVVGLIFVQLVLGAFVRHTESALALPDFPKTGGQWLPIATTETLAWVNTWRADAAWETGQDLPPVTLGQVWLHLAHRWMAVAVLIIALVLAGVTWRVRSAHLQLWRSALGLAIVLTLQAGLGISTVLSGVTPLVATLHVVGGATALALATLALLRALPVDLKQHERFPAALESMVS